MPRGGRSPSSRNRDSPLPDSDLLALNRFSRLRAWTLTGLATVALALTIVHRQTLAALAVPVTSALGISDVQYGWLSSGLAGAFLFGSLPAARLTQRTGPALGLILAVAATSTIIVGHSFVYTFAALLLLRIAMGLAASLAMPAATKTVHRVLPFRDRARGIGLLYLGNSLGSALCAPLAVALELHAGWRRAFEWVGLFGMCWIPLWLIIVRAGPRQPPSVDYAANGEVRRLLRDSLSQLSHIRGVVRGSLLVAAAAPTTLIMLIWAAKFLVARYQVPQHALGRYLWLPALVFGAGSLAFGEVRARTARSRASAKPPMTLVSLAALLCAAIAWAPFAAEPLTSTGVASIAMLGAGGLYTLATSDMLAHTPRVLITSTAGFTTFVQSLVYVVASPIIGKSVEVFGNYQWVMLGAGIWVLPLCALWLIDSAAH